MDLDIYLAYCYHRFLHNRRWFNGSINRRRMMKRLDRFGQAFSRRDTAPAVSADTRGRVSQQLKQCGYPINQTIHHGCRHTIHDHRSRNCKHLRTYPKNKPFCCCQYRTQCFVKIFTLNRRCGIIKLNEVFIMKTLKALKITSIFKWYFLFFLCSVNHLLCHYPIF